MRFYVDEYRGKKHGHKRKPYVVLTTDDWNDWNEAETLFHAKYVSTTERIDLGEVKVMTTKSTQTRKVIEREFTQLDDSYCSLGQSLEYYKEISKLSANIRNQILNGLRDVATNDQIAEKFKDSYIFKASLLRFSQAEKAYKEGKKFFGRQDFNKILNFKFFCKVAQATKNHEVELDFEEKDYLPYRINAFIGKNATGKTRVLTELASRLSGVVENRDNFVPARPSFSKIIAISYSAFDELYKPFDVKQEHNKTKVKTDREDENILFSYVYCGLRTRKGISSIDELENNFFSAYENVISAEREKQWEEIMKNVLEEEHFNLIDRIREAKIYKEPIGESLSTNLSSGQNILLSTMTEVISNIEYDSLLLFDEPEIHLHPNAIANFMRMFYRILDEFDSYAIISTHSPLIIQEIPSRYIRVFNRSLNTPYVEKLSNECFGENISNITNDVFEVREHESNYKTWFRKMVDQGLTKEEVQEIFDDNLSYNALVYLNSLYYNREKREEIF